MWTLPSASHASFDSSKRRIVAGSPPSFSRSICTPFAKFEAANRKFLERTLTLSCSVERRREADRHGERDGGRGVQGGHTLFSPLILRFLALFRTSFDGATGILFLNSLQDADRYADAHRLAIPPPPMDEDDEAQYECSPLPPPPHVIQSHSPRPIPRSDAAQRAGQRMLQGGGPKLSPCGSLVLLDSLLWDVKCSTR
jgi:hypothetical protein